MLYATPTTELILAAAKKHHESAYSSSAFGLIENATALVSDLFAGRHANYQKADLSYHNFDHTLLATQCFIDLAAGRINHRAQPAFTGRQFALGYTAIMLHDCGYLKTRDDQSGTGAKYTATHVERSCAMAALFLPALGCDEGEISGGLNAIRCTGLTSQIELLTFRNDIERLNGCMVATADYLGQMADPAYPAKLPGLFAEFEESNDFNNVPAEKRLFKSAQELMAKTRGFWSFFALPKLEKDYEGVYRLLAQPDGRNPYLESVDLNLTKIDAEVSK
jgi:hypothetical protein